MMLGTFGREGRGEVEGAYDVMLRIVVAAGASVPRLLKPHHAHQQHSLPPVLCSLLRLGECAQSSSPTFHSYLSHVAGSLEPRSLFICSNPRQLYVAG